MKLIWLGQSGFRFEFADGKKMLIDPYLSNYIAENENSDLTRLVPIEEKFLNEKADFILLSHSHSDHTDPNTLSVLFSNPENKDIYIISSPSVWKALRGKTPNKTYAFSLTKGTEMTLGSDLKIKAVHAVHSDPEAISFLITTEGKNIYVSADTLYHPEIINDLRMHIDLALVCINGAGNNMNYIDAARLVKEIKAEAAVPVHWDMLPGYTEDPERFVNALCGSPVKALVLEEYKEYDLQDILQKEG